MEADLHGAKLHSPSTRGMRRLLIGRTVLLGLALLSAMFASFYSGADGHSQSTFLYTPLSILFFFSVVSAIWPHEGALFTYAQLFVDVGIVTAAIYVTGSAVSPFLFLYLLPVMVASISLSRRTALVVTGMSFVAYTLLMLSLYQGWILSASGQAFSDLPWSNVLLQGIGLTSGMFLVAILTSYLATSLRSTRELMARSTQEIHELNRHQQTLIEGLPEGVITSGLDGKISNINQTALDLLGLSQEGIVGRVLALVLNEHGVDLNLAEAEKQGSGNAHEVDIVQPGHAEPLHILYHIRSILDASGSEIGKIYILQDVTKIRRIEGQLRVQEQMARLLSQPQAVSSDSVLRGANFVGESQIMKKVFNLIQRVAPSEATVLISGESGTGKELVARAIHRGSPRPSAPFVPVNCGAIPENLIESELFGYKKGAFTGADSDHSGLFRQAEGGTLFLDEIGELPLHMQTKLLRSLQSRSVRPVGGERDIAVNVRIVTATNRTLKKEVEKGNFREDLFYRLNVINISLPPLRDRKDDIPLLINATLKRLTKGRFTPVIPPATMQMLLNYDYPGNVRELENILERAFVLGGEVMLPEHLPDNVRHPHAGHAGEASLETQILIDENIEFPIKLDDLLATVERRYLEVALVRTNGARKKAADLLGMNFRSFRYRLQKFGIGDEGPE